VQANTQVQDLKANDIKSIVDAFLEGVHLWDIIQSSTSCVQGFENTFEYAVVAGAQA
jgi:hypothetical protein